MKKSILLFCILTLLNVNLFSTNYYIDFDNGNDANDGRTITTAWQHCPDDDEATGIAASTTFRPGDNVYFKGDIVYRGALAIQNSGSEGSPITYIGDQWPGLENVKATISGADPVELTWTQCTSTDIPGNSNYLNIYWANIPEVYSIFNHQFFMDESKIYYAQEPNISDPFWEDRFSEFNIVAKHNITHVSIIDSSFFTQSDTAYWNNSYVLVWVCPNIIEIREIESFIPAEHKIVFDSLNTEAIYGSIDQFYSVVNNLDYLDREGEFVIDEANHRIYLWPKGDPVAATFSLSQRPIGIDINGQSNITIEGFLVSAFTSEFDARGITNSRTRGDRAQNIIIRNNEVTNIKTRNGRKGSVSMNYMENSLLENNLVYNCQRNSGVFIGGGGVGIKALNNTIRKCGYKGIWVMNCKNAIIQNNDISECYGTHATGTSIFVSMDILITKNKYHNSAALLSFADDTNMIICNNLMYFVGDSNVGDMVRDNAAQNVGYLIVSNNTVINSGRNSAFTFGPGDLDTSKVIVKNNIVDGWNNSSIHCQTSNNIYTGLSWQQKEQGGWYLMPEESVEEDLSVIFQNPDIFDYRLLEGGPAIDAGVDITTELPASLLDEISQTFPDFSFNDDYLGRDRGNGAAWDIGAYEFYIEDTSTIVHNLVENGLDILVYPNPAKTSLNISLKLSEEQYTNISIYDISGRNIILSQNKLLQAGKNNLTIDLQAINSGIYIISVNNNLISQKQLFMKQ